MFHLGRLSIHEGLFFYFFHLPKKLITCISYMIPNRERIATVLLQVDDRTGKNWGSTATRSSEVRLITLAAAR